jgi:hypothetical protein
MTTKPDRHIELFYSYAQADETLRDELEKQLSLLKRQGYIATWYDRDINAGVERQQAVDTHLTTAHIILLLVSPDFMASDYCYDVEVKRALERHTTGEARVIPVLLRPVDWQEALFARLSPLPRNGQPVTQWLDRDAAFYDVVQGIRQIIEQLALSSPSSVSTGQLRYQAQEQFQNSPENQQSMLDSRTLLELERPATTFLSYAHENAEEVGYLQQQLHVHGVRAWLDATDLPLGRPNAEEIIQAIQHGCDACIVYVTPQCLASGFIWSTEVPAALQRHQNDPAFSIIPVLHGVSMGELQQQCTLHGYRDLTDFNGVLLLGDTTPDGEEMFKQELRSVASRTLRAALALRLRRIGAHRSYEPWICLKTFKDKQQTPSLDLELDWWDLFRGRGRLPSDEAWQTILLPALHEVKDALGEKPISRKVHISLQAILPAAFALGFAFPASSSFTLLLEGEQGTWSTREAAMTPSPLYRQSSQAEGDAHIAVIEIAITSTIAPMVAHYLSASNLSYGHHIRYDLPGGPDHLAGVASAAHASAIAQQIGKELRGLRGQGIAHIHLFAAIPANLAVMIGHQFNSLCPISLYYYTDGHYTLACVLGKVS